MRVQTVRPGELTPQQVATWAEIQAADSSLDSPFFCPEFSQLVGGVRNDVEIAVIEQGDQCLGFLPFHRLRGGIGRPIGLRLSDLHGAIVRPEFSWHADEIIRRCALSAWHFDHLIASQNCFRPFHWTEAASPYMDLSDGFKAYCSQRRREGSQLIVQIQRKSRQAERDLGPLRFVPRSLDDRDFEILIDWKSEQHRRTGVLEIFRIPWVKELANQVRFAQSGQFSGMLSSLFAGDKLLAVHLGMRSAAAWHIWFPAYDREFGRYSPGLILLMEMARVSAELGIRRIDLGKGPERYKSSLKSGAIRLAEGSVDCRPVMRSLRRGWHGMKHWIRSSDLRVPLNTPLRWTRRFRQWLAFV